VRQALRQLVAQGRLVPLGGRGTYATTLRKKPIGLVGYGDQAESWRDRLLSFRAMQPPASVARTLKLRPRERATLLRRLRESDTSSTTGAAPRMVPTALDSIWVPERVLCVPRNANAKGAAVARLLARDYRIAPSRVVQELRAARASPRTALLLEIPTGCPLFLVRRTAFDEQGRPFELLESLLRGDRYAVEADLRAPQVTSTSSARSSRRR
jgi:GntR family transcriptional regulator